MSSDARKKEKKRLKRKHKQEQLRKMKMRTPLSRIAAEGGRLECWVTRQFREYGMADIFVLGHAPGGRCAYSAFLVDLLCVGLKDTYGEADVTELDFRERVLAEWMRRSDVVRLDTAVARRLLAGGIRFARQNGFKLPAQWEKWASILSPLGNLAEADVSEFGKDGKLLYMGTAKFLRDRLIGSTPEQFLRRPDVEWITSLGEMREIEELDDDEADYVDIDDDDDDFEDDEDFDEEDEYDEDAEDEEEGDFDDEELDVDLETTALLDTLESLSGSLADAARKWCFANGQQPMPRLKEAISLTLLSMFPSVIEEIEEGPVSPPAVVEDMASRGHAMLQRYPRRVRREILESMQQVGGFFKQFKSPEEIYAAAGLNLPSAEDGAGPVGS